MHSLLMLAGGLAFFLYGIHILTGLMVSIAGGKVQESFTRVSKTTFSRFVIGLITTALFQSSSATTVILVSMASAGFVTLYHAIAFIVGANIGSTVTAWIVAVNITQFAIPLFVVGVFGQLFCKRRTAKLIALFFIGLGVIFFGLNMMSDAVRFLRNYPALIEWLARHDASVSVTSFLLLVVVGVLFTAIVQSSGATAAMMISAAVAGTVSFYSAAAVILGATLGTTITAFLASLGSGSAGRRVALVQVGINLFGITAGIVLFYPMTSAILSFPCSDIACRLALYMTSVKVLVLFVLPLQGVVARFVEWLIPQPFVTRSFDLIIRPLPFHADRVVLARQLRRYTDYFMEYLVDMLAFSYIVVRKSSHRELFDTILKYEKVLDEGHKKIASVIAESEVEDTDILWLYLKISDEVESIADHARGIAKYGIRMHDLKFTLSERHITALRHSHTRIFTIFHKVCIRKEFDEADLQVLHNNERFVRAEKRVLLQGLTTDTTAKSDIVLYLTDIFSEYSKINHSIKRILQVNLDNIAGRGPYMWHAADILGEDEQS